LFRGKSYRSSREFFIKYLQAGKAKAASVALFQLVDDLPGQGKRKLTARTYFSSTGLARKGGTTPWAGMGFIAHLDYIENQ